MVSSNEYGGKFWRIIGGRRFLGFIVATVLMWFDKIPADVWALTFVAYVGANVAQKALLGNGKGIRDLPSR